MRRISLCLSACLTLVLAHGLLAADPQAVDWHTDFAEAQAQSKELGLPLLLHFYGTHCPPCKVMEREVFASAEFRNAIPGKFVIAKLEAQRNRALVERFGVTSVPADVILNPKGTVVFRREGYQSGGSRIYLSSLSKYRGEAAPVERPAIEDEPRVSPKAATDKLIGVAPKRLVSSTNPGSDYAAKPTTRPGERLVPPPMDPVRLPVEEEIEDARADTAVVAQVTVPQERTPSEPIESALEADESDEPAVPVAKPVTRTMRWGLDGFSPVTLKRGGKWIAGSDEFVADYRGQKFRFADRGELEEFQKQPDLYVPQGAGLDLVVFEESGKTLPGS
ncbi:MAG: thioredoxin family protein, partial [Planctomycetota bacterium]|nr:thioredoxin family protein [Planctomycetota bacterium]